MTRIVGPRDMKKWLRIGIPGSDGQEQRGTVVAWGATGCKVHVTDATGDRVERIPYAKLQRHGPRFLVPGPTPIRKSLGPGDLSVGATVTIDTPRGPIIGEVTQLDARLVTLVDEHGYHRVVPYSVVRAAEP